MKSTFKKLALLCISFTLLGCAAQNPIEPDNPNGNEIEPDNPDIPDLPDQPDEPNEPDEPVVPEIIKHTVTFDYNGGTKAEGDPETLEVEHETTIATLPTPTKENYDFEGWFFNDDQLTIETIITQDLTAIAKFSQSLVNNVGVERKQRQRDYPLFDKVPEIKFTTDAGTDFATKPNRLSEKPEVNGTLTTSNCDSKYELNSVKASMKVRGNYTTNYTKKPFRIKFDSKTNLFGLNNGKKFKKWVLFADVKDNSMLRNATAFYLAGNMLNDNQFVSDFAPVHLYINDQYWGMYLLGEQKEVNSGRVSIAEPEKKYTGTDIGYFIEMDNYYNEEGPDGDPTFTVDYKPVMINQHHQGENFNHVQKGYTMGSDITDNAQLAYIKKRVEMTYTVMYNAVYNDKLQEIVDEQIVDSTETNVQKCLAKTIDIESFVGMYLLNEICCDPDIGYSSFYLSLDMSATGDKLMTLTNPWDWDSALGVRRRSVENSQGMYANVSSNMWLTMLCRTKFFNQLVKEKWAKLKEQKLFEKTFEMINAYTTRYKADYEKNFRKWPGNMGNNYETSMELRTVCTQCKTQADAKKILYDWLDARIKYLDTVFAEEGPGCFPPGSQVEKINFDKTKAQKTRYEAEDSVTDAKVKAKTGENISGNSYVGDLDGNIGRKMTFTVNSPKACTALLTAGLSARTSGDKNFFDLFNVTVNGQNLFIGSNIIVPQGRGTDYHCWTEVDVGLIKLNAGLNTIVLTAQSVSTNFDYIDIYIPN